MTTNLDHLWLRADAADFHVARENNIAGTSLSSDVPTFFYKLAGKPVYFGLNPSANGKGYDLTAVMNNGTERGMLPHIMQAAIALGAVTLDCWTVTLPQLYERFGFEVVRIEPYDVDGYGEPSRELLQAWRELGWKDINEYPGVAYMRLRKDARKAA